MRWKIRLLGKLTGFNAFDHLMALEHWTINYKPKLEKVEKENNI